MRWPRRGMLQFPLGLDTKHPIQQVPLGALRIAKNCKLDQRGSVTRRDGRATYGVDVGGATTGETELVLKDGSTKYLLRIYSGKLYASDDDGATWTNIPIRLYSPYPAYADDNTNGETDANGDPLNPLANNGTGAGGGNIVADTSYDYAVVAVYGAAKTLISATATIVAANPAEEIDLNWHGSYKATSYEIWRRATTGPGTWGQLATGVSHTTTGGKTLVQWTDDGTVAPDTGVAVPGSNDTDYSLPATTKVDWEIGIWSDENAAYFVAGDGYCRTNGTSAEIVTPTNPNGYLESAAGVNALGDVTWDGHKAEGIIRNHAYQFLCASADAPADFFWGRSDDQAHFPQLGRITVPRARGGETMDFGVKDDKLIVAMTTGLWALFGQVFAVAGPSASTYFKQLSPHGTKAPRSLVKAANGWLIYLSTEPEIRAVVTVEGTTDQLATIVLAPAIKPTLEDQSDHTNACAYYHNGEYGLYFPSDQKGVRLYLFESESNRGISTGVPVLISPVLDTQCPYRNFLVRQDGELLASYDTDGQFRQLANGDNADDGDAIPWEFEPAPLDLGDPIQMKHVRRTFVLHQVPNASVSVTVAITSEEMGSTLSETLDASGEGFDLSIFDEDVFDPWDIKLTEIDVDDEGRWWVVNVSMSSTDAAPRIYGFAFEAVYVHETAWE